MAENETVRRRVRQLEDEYRQALSGAVSGAGRILLRGTDDLIELAEAEIATVQAAADQWERRARRLRAALVENGIDPDPLWNDPEETAGAPPEAATVRPPRVRVRPEALARRRASLAHIADDPDQTAAARTAAAAILAELPVPDAAGPAEDGARFGAAKPILQETEDGFLFQPGDAVNVLTPAIYQWARKSAPNINLDTAAAEFVAEERRKYTRFRDWRAVATAFRMYVRARVYAAAHPESDEPDPAPAKTPARARDSGALSDPPIRFVTREIFGTSTNRVYHAVRDARRTLCGRDWRLWSGAAPIATFNGGRLCERCQDTADRFDYPIPPYNQDPAYILIRDMRPQSAPDGARTRQEALDPAEAYLLPEAGGTPPAADSAPVEDPDGVAG